MLFRSEDRAGLVSLGSQYYEPVWIFYRGEAELTRLSQLAGKRVSIGVEGGGTRRIANQLLDASGIGIDSADLLAMPGSEAATALREGRIDAMFIVGPPETETILGLMRDRAVKLMSLDQAEAFVRRLPFLNHIVLPGGAIDLQRNIPERDVHLLAPTATLIARGDLHPALVYLMLKAAKQVHGVPGLLNPKKALFPSDRDIDFPIAEEAEHFYRSGPPLLQRYLPFWMAEIGRAHV